MRSYEIVRPLGTGGMASVHLAREVGSEGRLFAIKRLHAFLEDDGAADDRLREEARLARVVRHPNVVRVLGIIEDEGRPAIAMEWIDGVDLATLAQRSSTRLPLDVVIGISLDLLEAIVAVHEATDDAGAPLSIIHGDVSAQNVIYGRDGVVRLVDFGLARSTIDGTAEVMTISGTLAYMAPEQLEGRVDLRSDLFAAGVVLWELLTGTPLRKATGGVEAFVEILSSDAPPPSAHRADAAFLDGFVLRALARAPEDRWDSARAMLEAFRSLVAAGLDQLEVTERETARGRCASDVPPMTSEDRVDVLAFELVDDELARSGEREILRSDARDEVAGGGGRAMAA
jgi:eukaryotic-like serine/threonine-protein kinase